MKKSFLIFTFLALICISSCDTSNNKVIFVNDAKKQIDSVFIFGNQKCNPLVFKNIKSGEIANGNLKNCPMKNSDGSYGVEVYYDTKIIKRGFGYYTNGWMHFEELKIVIKEDESIVINQK